MIEHETGPYRYRHEAGQRRLYDALIAVLPAATMDQLVEVLEKIDSLEEEYE